MGEIIGALTNAAEMDPNVRDEILAAATRFEIPLADGNTIAVEYRSTAADGTRLFAVASCDEVLDRRGRWRYEPIPSSRTDKFKAATRFPLAEAWAMAKHYVPRHYRFHRDRLRKKGKAEGLSAWEERELAAYEAACKEKGSRERAALRGPRGEVSDG